MSTVDEQTRSYSGMMRSWQRIPLWIRAVVSGVLVSSIGVYAWLMVGTLVPAPWSIVLMGMLLCLYVGYFRGSWWPKSTAEARKSRFRAFRMPSAVRKWSLVAALLIVVVWQSGMVLTFRLVEFPAEAFAAGYDLEAMSPWLAWLAVLMASLVAGICEETGYRGYMQVPLEARYGPAVAIAMVSILFLLIHLGQVWAPPVLLHLFALSVVLGILAHASGSLLPGMIAHTGLDIINFSYWWTDVAGTFDKRPVGETGIDAHLLFWALLFVASAVLFFWAARKTLAARGRTQVG